MPDKLRFDNDLIIIKKPNGREFAFTFDNIRHYLEELKNEPHFMLQNSRERIFDLLDGSVTFTIQDIREILVAQGFLEE